MFTEYLDFAKDIAYKAGEISRKYFTEDNGAFYKPDNTVVTRADREINELLIERVREKFPLHAVDGEEDGYGKSRFVWVCDPVDGTAMYARHIPESVFSLALVDDGEPVVGVIYDPFSGSIFYATKGGGAYRDGNRIRTNGLMLDKMKTIANFDTWPDAEYNLWDSFSELGKTTYSVSLGSIIRAASYVACGKFSLAVYPGTKHKNCDIAAAKIIVEEAGGRVTDLFGNEQRYDKDINGAVISNGIIHEHVISVLRKNLKQ